MVCLHGCQIIKQIYDNRRYCIMHDDSEFHRKLGVKIDELSVLVTEIFLMLETATQRLNEAQHGQKLVLLKRVKSENDPTDE